MFEKLPDYPVPRRVFALLLLCIASLLLLSVTAKFLVVTYGTPSAEAAHPVHPRILEHLVEFLDVRREKNLPSWFSSTLLLSAAFLATLCGLLCRRHGRAWKSHWLSIGLLFLLLSLDEAAGVHERLILPLRAVLETRGLFRYAWVIPGAIAVLVLSAVYFRFVLALPTAVRRGVIAGAAVFIGGALGMEMVGGAYHDQFGNEDLGYSLITTVEEGMEMLGIALFIRALLRYVETTFSWKTAVKPGPLIAEIARGEATSSNPPESRRLKQSRLRRPLA